MIALAAGALTSVATAQTRPFSHKFHLAMKLDCVACHTGAPSSTRASDNNLPPQEACRKCHDRAMPVKPPAVTLVTSFNHALHIKLGNIAPVIAAAIDGKTYHLSSMGAPPPPALRAGLNAKHACAGCHRGVEESEVVSRDLLPQMQDCLVCHPKIDPPFSCGKCHTEGKHLQPASHVRGWVDIHSTGKANLNKPSCVVCHAKRFSCLGCHN